MLTLALLKPLRLSRSLSRTQLTAVTGITDERLRKLDLKDAEPWFDEALLLSRALGLTGIVPLLDASGNLMLSSPEFTPLPTDLDHWRGGARAPLSLAMRIAHLFGLPDPALLWVEPLHRQVWDVLEANERHPEASGWCPWCGVDRLADEAGERAGHLPSCLPNNLWSTSAEPVSVEPLLRPAERDSIGAGIPAHGLRAAREAAGMTQREVAGHIDVHRNYYARLERAETALTSELADRIAQRFGVDKASLYVRG